ncbi:hypothetical protein [Janthinobacterium sp. Ant5-2-1]|uniref:hypothetical protein n=1 Tax=Janthinobacterium sp. Ant5-2-1 TaxID=1755239 RepID=UPI000A8D2459|nr:hypothetical protein [Janthinobacterium sp. Ant5-2-1]
MATKTLKTVPKISIRIWRPIIDKLDEKMELACLRRDAYLARVLAVELDALDEEVSIPNSQASYEFVSASLSKLDRKLVSLVLPPDLIERLNDVCKRKRIVRDAFFNRVFLLLAAESRVIDALLFADATGSWRREVWGESKLDGPFFQNGFYPLAPTIDPFWALRHGLDIYSSSANAEDFVEHASGKTIRITRDITGTPIPIDSLYTKIFENKVGGHDLLGLSCYLSDSRVPGERAEYEHRVRLDEMFAELGVLP